MAYFWDEEAILKELEETEEKMNSLPRFALTSNQKMQRVSLENCKESLEKVLYILKSHPFEEEEASYQAYQNVIQERDYPKEETISPRHFRKFFYQYNHVIPIFYFRLIKKNVDSFLVYDFEPLSFPEITYSSQDLIDICHDILKESGNKEVLSSYEKIVSHSPSLLCFQNKEHMMQGQTYQVYGLTLPIPALQKTYIHCILQNNYHDLCCFFHEMFHAIFACYDCPPSYGNIFFSEIEGHLSERIIERYWQENHFSSDLIMISRLNRCYNALICMNDFFLGNLLLKTASFGKFYFSRVNQSLEKKGSILHADACEVSQIFETTCFHKVMNLTSYLGGLDFMNVYENDSEKALDCLFRLKKDQAPLSRLLKTYPFSFQKGDWSQARKEFDQSQDFYQKKMEMTLK